MDMFPAHQVWSKPYCKAQSKGEEDKAGKKRSGETTLGNGQVELWQDHEGSAEQRKMEETGGEVVCDTPTTLEVKG